MRRDRADRTPVQPPGDHQMQNKPEIVFQPDADPLAHAAKLNDLLVFRLLHGWTRSAKE